MGTKWSGLYPVEIKYTTQLKSSDFKGLLKFNENYPHRGLFLVNLNSNVLWEEGVMLLTPFEIAELNK